MNWEENRTTKHKAKDVVVDSGALNKETTETSEKYRGAIKKITIISEESESDATPDATIKKNKAENPDEHPVVCNNKSDNESKL